MSQLSLFSSSPPPLPDGQMRTWEIVSPSGGVAYRIPATSREGAELRAKELCGKVSFTVSVREMKCD